MDIWSGVGTVLNNSSSVLYNFFPSSPLPMRRQLIFVFFIFLWIISIIRTARDIISRTNSSSLQIFSIIVVTLLSPLFGLPIYLVLRPITFKKDMQLWKDTYSLHIISCTNCQTLNPKEYECCINCGEKLKIVCKQCNKEYPHMYPYCHNCGAPNIE